MDTWKCFCALSVTRLTDDIIQQMGFSNSHACPSIHLQVYKVYVHMIVGGVVVHVGPDLIGWNAKLVTDCLQHRPAH